MGGGITIKTKVYLQSNQNECGLCAVATLASAYGFIQDGLIQVITIRGKTVILNRSYSKVWLAIDDEIYRENLIEKMKDLIPKETLIQILNNLEEQELVSM